MAGSDGQNASSAGAHLATKQAGTSGLPLTKNVSDVTHKPESAVRLQPGRIKTQPPSSRRFCGKRGVGGSRAYVHTPIGTSSGQVFEGSTDQYIEEYRSHKRAKHLIAAYLSLKQCGRMKQAQALLSCGRWFRRLDFPCGTYRLIPMHCDSPFCAQCAARRSRPLQKRIAAKMKQSKHDYFHLTVTVENWLTLTGKGLTELIEKFARLRDRKLWTDKVTGGVWSLECIWSKSDSWHPHFHVLIETPKRLPMDWIHKLKEEWREITGGSHVMRLDKMYGLDPKGRKTRKLNKRGLGEIVKYATKASDFSHSPQLVEEFVSAFENVRRVQAFGSFIGCISEKKNKSEDGSLAGEDESSELVGCECGKCYWKDGRIVGPEYHLSQTEITFPGQHRQLRLFDSGHDPPKSWIETSVDDDTYARREVQTANASQFALPGVLPQQEWIGFMSTVSRSNG
jgi:replication protein